MEFYSNFHCLNQSNWCSQRCFLQSNRPWLQQLPCCSHKLVPNGWASSPSGKLLSNHRDSSFLLVLCVCVCLEDVPRRSANWGPSWPPTSDWSKLGKKKANNTVKHLNNTAHSSVSQLKEPRSYFLEVIFIVFIYIYIYIYCIAILYRLVSCISIIYMNIHSRIYRQSSQNNSWRSVLWLLEPSAS